MAFKFRAASGDLSGSPSARGTRPRRDLHGFQDLAELDAQYYASAPRQWYSRAPGGPNYQHRSEFCFSLAENPQFKHQASSPRLAAKVTPPPQPGLGMYKRTLRDPAQVAGNLNSKIKFGVHQRLAESAPLIAGASKAVPLLYLHACSGCNGEARRSRSRAHPGSGPVTDPGPSIFHKFSPPSAGLLRKRWTFNLAEK